VSLEIEWVLCHILWSKTWSRKGLISYKTKNGTSTMKKHCGAEHSSIFKMYVNEIIQQCFVETNALKKQSSKVWKVVIPGSISIFFNSTTTYKKVNEEQKAFIWFENIQMRHFDLWKDPQLMFPSCKILIEKV